MRMFIRHPSDVPIEVQSEGSPGQDERYLNDVSDGGLSFRNQTPIEEGSLVRIRIPVVRPVFETRGRVIWCKSEEGFFDIGIEFVETKDVFKARMIEQICHIEHYKKEIHEKEGRVLSGKEAALEWISKYANTFQAEVMEK